MDATCRAALSAINSQLRMQPHGLTSLLDELPLAPDRAGSCTLHISKYKAAAIQGAASSTAANAAAAPGEAAAADMHGTEAHVDRGLLTLVSSGEDGLEVLGPDGVWRRVVLGPGELALMPGWSLEFATAGAVAAAKHRVVSKGSDEGGTVGDVA